MNPKENREFAESQLSLIMGFFPRVDAKASALFAIDTALLALVSLNLRPPDFCTWLIVPACVAIVMVVASLFFVFRCSFPHLSGGERSLVYFREIAKRTEVNFVTEFSSASDDELRRDLLGQVWRNSQILKIKFDAVRVGFILTLIALIPWCIFLVAAGFYHGQIPSLK